MLKIKMLGMNIEEGGYFDDIEEFLSPDTIAVIVGQEIDSGKIYEILMEGESGVCGSGWTISPSEKYYFKERAEVPELQFKFKKEFRDLICEIPETQVSFVKTDFFSVLYDIE